MEYNYLEGIKNKRDLAQSLYNNGVNFLAGYLSILEDETEKEIQKKNAYITALETAGRELLEVCHCTNDCSPSDMSCATNKMLAALYGIENVKKQLAILLEEDE